MLTFFFQTTIADIDGTVESDPEHPSLVLILEMDENFIKVVVPDGVLAGRRELLAVGETVKVSGEVKHGPYGAIHVASDLSLEAKLH